MRTKATITNLPLYATDSKDKRIKCFKIVRIGPVAVGCIKDNTTEKEFLQLHCENCETLQAKNKRLKLALADIDLHAGSNLVQGIAREALKDKDK